MGSVAELFLGEKTATAPQQSEIESADTESGDSICRTVKKDNAATKKFFETNRLEIEPLAEWLQTPSMILNRTNSSKRIKKASHMQLPDLDQAILR